MKSIKRIFFLLSFISVSYLSTLAQENQSYFLHTIEKGQSLYSISSMYGVSKADIIRLNPGCEDKIYAGQAIKIPQNKTAQKSETFHTIQPGETLYRLTTTYKVSAKAICDANPGLSAENFRIGQVIRIPSAAEAIDSTVEAVVTTPEQPIIQPAVKPRCRDMHKVKRRETIFSVSREYGISEQELIAANPELKNGMKKGQFLCIPYPSEKSAVTTPQTDTNITPPSNSELFRENKETPKSISTIKAALLLPFDDKRMVEYYEGFLMAVDSLKRTGTSIDLYVYDCNKESSSLNNILAKSEMKNMNVIFGPAQQQHIKPLAAFAKKNDIRLVVPFSSKEGEVFSNPFIYQINTPQSYLYSEVYEHFTRQFPNANVILLESSVVDKDKVEFIKGLKQELGSKGIPVKTLKENAPVETLKAALRNDKENFFIPTSGNDLTLLKIIPQLTLLVRDNPEARIHLFGYPEWQTYTKDHLESFFELDTYFYSSFYTNNLLPAAINFTHAYRKWYSKEMEERYPKYGMLGFDTGYFFLQGLSKYGSELEKNLPLMDLTPIQTGFKFQRVNNWGGFVNKKVFFVHFTKNFELIKLDFE
ncbi:muramidase family protein [Bacteroides fragilis]|uniref:LysM peptidoglycan-binding domain-containing protein n=1 Tax=Bacteroides fragilis TaxID=817 RepID=A0ABD4VTG5_BACFG|nr:LysM peptidoglycan-binding domain-containing protein [Bacteroides fragilis]MCZ2654736.1 LysM peptidoglycan-binding domain-containing protein [Bacteroides fragilis]